MSTLTASLGERIDGEVIEHVTELIADSPAADKSVSTASSTPPTSTAPIARSWTSRIVERIAKRFGVEHLFKLAAHRGDVIEACRELPRRMHLVAKQTQLILELVDDFRSGRYRRVPWRSIAIGAAALLYVASPADVIPDTLLGVGALDDIVVLAVAARALRNDLKAYCEFKHYAVDDYFAIDTDAA